MWLDNMMDLTVRAPEERSVAIVGRAPAARPPVLVESEAHGWQPSSQKLDWDLADAALGVVPAATPNTDGPPTLVAQLPPAERQTRHPWFEEERRVIGCRCRIGAGRAGIASDRNGRLAGGRYGQCLDRARHWCSGG